MHKTFCVCVSLSYLCKCTMAWWELKYTGCDVYRHRQEGAFGGEDGASWLWGGWEQEQALSGGCWLQIHLDQVAQSLIQPGLEHPLQGWGIHNFSGQPVPQCQLERKERVWIYFQSVTSKSGDKYADYNKFLCICLSNRRVWVEFAGKMFKFVMSLCCCFFKCFPHN